MHLKRVSEDIHQPDEDVGQKSHAAQEEVDYPDSMVNIDDDGECLLGHVDASVEETIHADASGDQTPPLFREASPPH